MSQLQNNFDPRGLLAALGISDNPLATQALEGVSDLLGREQPGDLVSGTRSVLEDLRPSTKAPVSGNLSVIRQRDEQSQFLDQLLGFLPEQSAGQSGPPQLQQPGGLTSEFEAPNVVSAGVTDDPQAANAASGFDGVRLDRQRQEQISGPNQTDVMSVLNDLIGSAF